MHLANTGSMNLLGSSSWGVAINGCQLQTKEALTAPRVSSSTNCVKPSGQTGAPADIGMRAGGVEGYHDTFLYTLSTHLAAYGSDDYFGGTKLLV